MSKSSKKIIIWGAGKIGRGFIADLFASANYEITFIEQDLGLVQLLRKQGQYHVKNLPNGQPEEIHNISHFKVLASAEKGEINRVIQDADLLALALFPKTVEQLVPELQQFLENRWKSQPEHPLDLLMCTNSPGIASRLRESLFEVPDPAFSSYLEEKIGLVECLLMRIVIDPDPKEKSLNLTTNGYPRLVMDLQGFKGTPPEGELFRLTDRIEAEECRKIFTYNMLHAVFAYGGARKNYQYINQATEDPELLELARLSLEEVAFGLQQEFGFSQEEMDSWNKEALVHMTNPVLEDTIFRVANDPERKLSRQERLMGPALLCRKHGAMPYFLGLTIYHALHYLHPDDPASQRIKYLREETGLKSAFEQVASIDREKELTGMMLLIDKHQQYPVKPDLNYIRLLKRAYQLGFHYEKKFRGCAQCLLGAMYELTGKKDDNIFRAASAFSGGMSLCGDGVCGGYTGGLMFMGLYSGRRLEHFSGDKEEQYKAYLMGQMMHDKYMETYGTVTCKHIHEEIYGQAYILRTKEVRNRFEEAGAHRDKCTSVIGMAAVWLTEILTEENLLDPQTIEV